MGWTMKQSTPKRQSEWEQLHDSNPGCMPIAQTSHTPEHSSATCCLWVIKPFPLYAWLLGLLSQQSSKRWAQLLFLLTIKIINMVKFFFIHFCTNPPRPEMPFHSPVIKRAEAGAKHQTEACLTWVTGGLFTVPLQIPMPVNVFPVVSCARDSRQFPPCLIIPGISSFSGTLEVK